MVATENCYSLYLMLAVLGPYLYTKTARFSDGFDNYQWDIILITASGSPCRHISR